MHAKGFGSYLPDFKKYINSPDFYNRFQKIAKIYKNFFYFHIWCIAKFGWILFQMITSLATANTK